MKLFTNDMLYRMRHCTARIVEGPGTGSIMPIRDAIQTASDNSLDLVLVNDNVRDGTTVIAKIIDYKKFSYDQKKREKELKKKQRMAEQKTKEVKFHIGIDDGDYSYKVNHIREFLAEGDRVNCQIVLRGRECASEDIVNAFVRKLSESISGFAESQNGFTRNGKIISSMLTGKK